MRLSSKWLLVASRARAPVHLKLHTPINKGYEPLISTRLVVENDLELSGWTVRTTDVSGSNWSESHA